MWTYLHSAARDWLSFWQQVPALWFAFAALLGCSAAFYGHPILLFPVVLAAIPLIYLNLTDRRTYTYLAALAGALACAAYFYCSAHYQLPELPSAGIYAKARLSFQSVSEEQGTLGKTWLYQGQMSTLSAPARITNAPFRLRLPLSASRSRPLANQAYVTDVKVRPGGGHFYALSQQKGIEWEPIPSTWSFAEWRYGCKKAVGHYIESHISNPRSASFLTGLATGMFSDRQIKAMLGRFGLQHVMAISGFHFAIVAAMLSLPLGCFLPARHAAIVLALLLTLYFVFLGYSASITRAWLMAMVALGGRLLGKAAFGLNALGCAMLALILLDPPIVTTLAFQLSFLATAAILLLYQPTNYALQALWGKRCLSRVVTMTRLEQHGYLMLSFFRQAFALCLAVHLVVVPVVLIVFHKFPLMSLLYNLFFPFLVSISMFLLLVASVIQVACPPIANLIHDANSHYTQMILNLVFNAPPALNVVLYSAAPPPWLVVPYLCCLGVAGIWARQHMAAKAQLKEDFAFL